MKKGLLLCLIVVFVGSTRLWGQQPEMFKALYMYNFTKNIEWPVNYRKGDFIIGVLGSTSVTNELQQIANRRKTGSQSIVIKKFPTVDDIQTCHILYIPTNKSNALASVLKKLGEAPTLIITDKSGLASEGALINYVTLKGEQKFEINPQNFIKHNLKVSQFLLSLGIVVED